MADHREEVIAANGNILVMSERANTLFVCSPNGHSDQQIANAVNSFPWPNQTQPWTVKSDYGMCPDFEYTRRHTLLTHPSH